MIHKPLITENRNVDAEKQKPWRSLSPMKIDSILPQLKEYQTLLDLEGGKETLC